MCIRNAEEYIPIHTKFKRLKEKKKSNAQQKLQNCDGENAYGPVHLKRKLRDHFVDNIIITDIVGKSSVVTLRETAKSILQTFYNRPQNDNHEDEKKAIIKAAAQLIKSDVQSLTGEKEVYPTAKDIGSTEANLRFIPDSLKLFLRNLCGEKNNDLKVSSMG